MWDHKSSERLASVPPSVVLRDPLPASNPSSTNMLEQLRPSTKLSVYEVLHQLNFDLSEWAVNGSGRQNRNPAVNGRAYAWSYADAQSGQNVFMLWHEDMEERDGRIFYHQDWRGVIAELERSRPMTAKRADNFLRHVARLKPGALVRVSIVEGNRARSSDDESSRVAKRMLDPEVWHLSYWDPLTNTYEFVRGLPVASSIEDQEDGESFPEHLDDDTLQIQHDIKEIIGNDIGATEKQQLIAARLGQGRFRFEVLERWQRACAVTGSTTLAVIRASHCKPWRSGTNEERLDPANGLPLIATLDALFDAGLITFGEDGLLIASPRLTDSTLGVDGLKLRRSLHPDEKTYLDYHRREIFRS